MIISDNCWGGGSRNFRTIESAKKFWTDMISKRRATAVFRPLPKGETEVWMDWGSPSIRNTKVAHLFETED